MESVQILLGCHPSKSAKKHDMHLDYAIASLLAGSAFSWRDSACFSQLFSSALAPSKNALAGLSLHSGTDKEVIFK